MTEPNTKQKQWNEIRDDILIDAFKKIKVHKPNVGDGERFRRLVKESGIKFDIHKPDKLKETVSRNGRCNATSCLGEKQLMVCKTCRKLSFDLKEKNSKDLVAELRSKNPFPKHCLISEAEGYDSCCDKLEKMLKVKK